MKKIIISIPFLFISICAFNQVKIDFVMGMRPQLRYDQSLNQKINIEINLDSSTAEMISKMADQGMKNPSTQQMEMTIESVVKTGSLEKKSGKFPVNLEILKSETNKKASIAPGTMYFGTASPDHLPVYDSINLSTLDEKQRAQMIEMVNSLSSQLVLPQKRMGIGDTCSVITPIRMPFNGINLNMDFIAIYRLNDIKGSVAHLDEKVTIRMNMEIKDLPLTGFGSGSGTVDYDMEHHYLLRNDLKYQMKFRMQSEGLIMHMLLNANIQTTSRIQKN